MAVQVIRYHSQREAERMVPPPHSVLIRVGGSHYAEPEPGWLAVYDAFLGDPPSLDQVGALTAIFDGLGPDVEQVHIHCLAGMSRSPAVAMWACERYGIPFEQQGIAFPSPAVLAALRA